MLLFMTCATPTLTLLHHFVTCEMSMEYHGVTWVMKAQRMSFQLFTNFTLPRDIGSDPFGGPAR